MLPRPPTPCKMTIKRTERPDLSPVVMITRRFRLGVGQAMVTQTTTHQEQDQLRGIPTVQAREARLLMMGQ